MDKPFKIFIVDDDPVARMIIRDQLEDREFELHEFEGGSQCLDAMGKEPDLILMDVEMPDMSGISACRKIRESGDQVAQVLFISSHDDIETRLSAYDAGGTDFISKPYAPEELATKVSLAQKALEERQGLSAQADMAQKMAFSAISSMGETGVVMHFLRASFTCSNVAQLAAELLNGIEQYGLRGAVAMNGDLSAECFSSNGSCTQLELSILEKARLLERIFTFKDRMSINYPHVTLIVSGLPTDDEDKVGRLRDHLALIVEAADVRLVGMENEVRRVTQADGVLRVVKYMTKAMKEIEEQQMQNRDKILSVGSEHIQKLEASFMTLGLTEGQEAELLSMAQASAETMMALQDAGDVLSAGLRETVNSLEQLVADE